MTFQNHLKGYQLSYSNSAKKMLKKLDRALAKKVEEKLDDLVQGEENVDVKQLKAYSTPTYRLRIGDIRAIYEVYEHTIIVYVIKVGHRRDIYD